MELSTKSGSLDDLTYPATCRVHLYRDEGIRANPSLTPGQYPILFADCEGFKTGSKTNAKRAEESPISEALHPHPVGRGRNFSIDPRHRSPSRRREADVTYPVRASCYTDGGKDGIDLFYARFLYAVSDVIVFVTKEDAKIQSELTRVLEWASKAVHKSVNHPSRKMLIIVRNMPSDLHDPRLYDSKELKRLYLDNDDYPKLWEESSILRDFVNEYNGKKDRSFIDRITSSERFYKALFNEITCCYVPHRGKVKGNPQELFLQYRRLRGTIEDSVRVGLQLRAESVMQYNVPALTHILNRAFEHFTTSEQPFDFYLAARRDNPNPHSMGEHVANFLRHVHETEAKGNSDMAEMTNDAISIALLVFTHRNFSEVTNPAEIFERDLYAICKSSAELYVSQYERCRFVFPDGQQCTMRPANGAGHDRHRSQNEQIEPGAFVPSRPWHPGNSKGDWIRDIQRRFIQSYQDIFIPPDPHHHIATVEQRLSGRREWIHLTYHDKWKMIKSNKTCLSCLQEIPDHVLTCGHSYCPRCVQELGHVSPHFECAWNIHCWLCYEEKGRNSHLVQLKPRCSGVRILALDGGGVRGIVELLVLQALHKAVGLEPLPLKSLFDLIVGTSTGGIIALALAMSTKGSESLPEMMAFFNKASENTFAQSALKKILQYGRIVAQMRDSTFDAKGLRQALQDYFQPKDTALFAPALHTQLMSSGTRVAVTSAKDGGRTACLIASYNHPSPTEGSACLEREEDAEKDMKIWEAAMATSAAPYYLPCFEKPQQRTSYVDGAVWANCPAQVAYTEMEKLWPGDTASLDVLVSLGTGMQDAKPFEMPALVNMGFLAAIRAMFKRQMDSKATWLNFVTETAPPHVRPRLHRLDPPLRGGDDPVRLYDYKMIPDLQERVSDWTGSAAQKEIALIADTLVANLFFFEPDDGIQPQSAKSLLSDKTNDVLQGTIRCPLGYQTPQLVRLLGLVEDFAFTQLDVAPGDTNLVEKVRQLPTSRWEPIRTTLKEGHMAKRASSIEMMAVDGHSAVPKFRVPYTIVVQKGSLGPLVLGVKLHRRDTRISISGFPVTMPELKRRASQVWLR